MNLEFVSELYDPTNDTAAIKRKLESFSRVSNIEQWKAMASIAISQSTTDNNEILWILMEYAMERILNGNIEDSRWIWSITSCVAKGFKILSDSPLYESWLTKMKEFTKYGDQITRSQAQWKSLYEPRLLSIIGILTYLNFVERYTMIYDHSLPSKGVQEMELRIVQNVIDYDSFFVVFPLSFVADHILNIFAGPPETARTIESILTFLESYFKFKRHLIPDFNVDSEILYQWRTILISYDEDNDLSTPPTSVSNLNLCRDVLFVDAVFTPECSVYLENQRFTKKYSEFHSTDVHQRLLLDLCNSLDLQPISDISGPEIEKGLIFWKCLIMRDSLCQSSHPVCCSWTPNCGAVCFFLDTLEQDKVGDKRSINYNYLIRGVLELKNTLVPNQDRFKDLLRFCETLCFKLVDTNLSAEHFFKSLSPAVLKMILDEFGQSSNSLLHTMAAKFTADQSNVDSEGFVWQTIFVDTRNADLITQLYLGMMNGTKHSRKAMLAEIENGLRQVIKVDAYQEMFQSVLQNLSGLKFKNYDTEETMIAYFDILILADENPTTLFMVNVQILYFKEKGEQENEELEEGEEGAAVEPMDIVVAADRLFMPLMLEYEKSKPSFYSPRNYSKILPNILLFDTLMLPPPSQEKAYDDLKDQLLERWNYLIYVLPSFVWKESVLQIGKEYYPKDKPKILDRILVDFTFAHALGISECFIPIWSSFSRQSVELDIKMQPFGAFISHFGKLDKTLDDSHFRSEYRFLKYFSDEVVALLAKVEISKVQIIRTSKKKKGKKIRNYDFDSISGFPHFQISFLRACLKNSPKSLRYKVFKEFVASIKFDRTSQKADPSYDPLEVLLVALVFVGSELSYELCGELMVFLFYQNYQQSEKAVISDQALNPEYLQPLFQTYFFGNQKDQTRSQLWSDLLSTPVKLQSKLVSRVLDILFGPFVLSQIDNFTKNWMPTILRIAGTSSSMNIARAVLQKGFNSNNFQNLWRIDTCKLLLTDFYTPETKFVIHDLLKPRFEQIKPPKPIPSELFQHHHQEFTSDIKMLLNDCFEAFLKPELETVVALLEFYTFNPSGGFKVFIESYLNEALTIEPFKETMKWGIEQYLSNFVNLFQGPNVTPAIADAVEKFILKLIDLLSPWCELKEGKLLEAILAPMNVDLLLHLTKYLNPKPILDFLYVAHSKIQQFSIKFTDQFLLQSDLIWATYSEMLFVKSIKFGLFLTFSLLSEGLIDLFDKKHMKLAETLLPMVLYHVNPNIADQSFELLGHMTHCAYFNSLILPRLDTWFVSYPSNQSLVILIGQVVKSSSNPMLEERVLQYLQSCLKEKDLAIHVLECLVHVHPSQTLEMIDKISEHLTVSAHYNLSKQILMNARLFLTLPFNGRGHRWFDTTIDQTIKKLSQTSKMAGVQAVLLKSLREIRNLAEE